MLPRREEAHGVRAPWLKAAVAGLSALGCRGERRLSILIFHRVTDEVDPLFPEEMHGERFASLMETMASNFNVLGLREAIDRTARHELPPRAVCITFDDGYADNLDVAAPILKCWGLPATVFVASGFLDGGLMWNDEAIECLRNCAWPQLDLAWLGLGSLPLDSTLSRRQAIERVLGVLKYRAPVDRRQALDRLVAESGVAPRRDLMLTSAQLRLLPELGVEIGGHTRDHPILAVLPEDEARRQIGEDREHLQSLLGEAPRYFAYPNGGPGTDYLAVHVDMVKKAGYAGAVSTAWGSFSSRGNPYQIPRFTPWDRGPVAFALRLAHNAWRRGERVCDG